MNSVRKRNTLVWKVMFFALIMGTVFNGLWAQFAGGEGTVADPWQIATAQHLDNIRAYLGDDHSDKHFIQIADIELGIAPWNVGQGWVPIGSSLAQSFQGTYDGGEYIISNLTINRTAPNQGLFGYTVSATIRNVGLPNINFVFGGSTDIGALIGTQNVETLVERCYATGTIIGTGTSRLGGLVGRLFEAGCMISDSYTNVNITRISPGGFDTVNPITGGIIGEMTNGVLRGCYAFGKIVTSTSNRASAVVGVRLAGEISHIYWNRDNAGRDFGVGQEEGFPGNTTLEMLRRNTYQGFNFTDNWSITEGISYPYLPWQDGPHPVNIPGPRNLTGQGRNESVYLSWQTPIMEIEPLGYNIYRDGQRVNGEIVEELNYLDTGLTNWQEYDYYVTALFEIGESYFSNLSTVAPTAFAGGTGTQDNPYQVATAEHLNNVRLSLNSHYIQTANIDIGIPPFNVGEGWVPIGNTNARFTGHYNGNHYHIENLTLNRHGNPFAPARDQALFGYIREASLTGIIINNADVDTDFIAGILVGTADGSTISQSSVYGTIKGTNRVGGIAGYAINETQISECFSYGIFNATNARSEVGGLVGQVESGSSIFNSYSNATVIGNEERVGGLIGGTSGAETIVASYATGWVTANFGDTHLGGLIGLHNIGEVTDCYWNIQTTGQTESPGGGEGRTTEEMVIADSYNNWDFVDVWAIDQGATYPYLRWQENAGFHNIPNPYNFTVEADYENELIAISWQFIGEPQRYDIYRNNILLTSINHPEMSYNDTDCDLYTEYSYYVKAVFIVDEEEIVTLPTHTIKSVLLARFAGGDGSIDNPYQIETAQQLNNIRYLLNSNFIQITNINLGVEPWNVGMGWESIGTHIFGNRFTGTYDGQEYVISNLTINRPTEQYQGLFAYAYQATLQNIIIEDVSIVGQNNTGGLLGFQDDSVVMNCSTSGTLTTANSDIGGLVGKISSANGNLILNSHSSANVNGYLRTGGLVGHNVGGEIVSCWATGNINGGAQMHAGGLVGYSEAIIRESFATGNVSGNATYRGGLAGVNSGTVTNCYARGNVSGSNYVGGLLGRNSGGRVTNSYSTGTAASGGVLVGGLVGSNTGEVDDSNYWDTETSQHQTSHGGQGRITRQMVYPTYDPQTYVDWDFDEIWTDDVDNINNNYPIFQYQYMRLDTPQVEIEIVNIEGIYYSRLAWEPIDSARSYKIYASVTPDAENWGEPSAIVGETHYLEPIDEGGKKFYYVIASVEQP